MIGNRLKRAREAVGLSLRDLEGAIHGQVSAQAIGKYERGEMMPGSTVLLALSKALHITPEFLLSEREVELTGVDFRKAPQAGAKEERAVEASVLDQVERYLELEELLPGMDDAWAAPDGPEFEIHRVEEITGRPRYRRLLDEMRASPDGQRLLDEQPELSSEQVDYDALRALPASTLGGAYVRHLDDNKITADYQAAKTRHVDDPDMAYLMRRFRQTHDVWHALLGIGITGHEEVIIHWFSYGQLRLPVSALIMVFGTMKHLVLERRFLS